MNIDKDNIDKLTDEELFKALRESGLTVGPITPTTRSLYERRLKNFIEGNSTTLNTTVTISSSPEVAPPSTPKNRSPSPKKSAPTTPKSSPSPKRATPGNFFLLKDYQI